jgi:phenylacetyl-CoA:acceptor oxidoreductase subunit 2
MKQIVQASRQRFWDWRAACNFCFGGTGSGLILAAGLGWALGTPSSLAVMTALVFIGFGLTMVWLEIGRPWRAINVMFHPQTSWMTRESIVAPLLFASGVATVAIDFRFVVVTAVLAAGFLYCQARMLQASRGIPAWCQKESVPLIVATGLAGGGRCLSYHCGFAKSRHRRGIACHSGA